MRQFASAAIVRSRAIGALLLLVSALALCAPRVTDAGIPILDWALGIQELPRDGEFASVAIDINDDNFVLGHLLDPMGQPTAAVVWAPAACPPDCSPFVFSAHQLPEAVEVTAISNIAQTGHIVVSGVRVHDDSGELVPAVFRFFNTSPQNITSPALTVPNGYVSGAALDVNRAGDAVGFLTATDGREQAFFWDAGSSYAAVELDGLRAVTISDDGSVIVERATDYALIPDAQTDPTILIPLAGGSSDLFITRLGQEDRRSQTGLMRLVGAMQPDTARLPIVFADPLFAPDTFLTIQTPTGGGIAESVDSTGQVTLSMGSTGDLPGYTSLELDASLSPACFHDSTGFDLGYCDLNELLSDPTFTLVGWPFINEQGTIAVNAIDDTLVQRAVIVAPQLPRIWLSPASFFFGGVAVGATESRIGTIENVGAADLEVTDFLIFPTDTDFTLSAEPVIISPGDTYDYAIIFAPSIEGPHTFNLAILSNDPINPDKSQSGFGIGCPPGFEDPDGTGVCTDIDECAGDLDDCGDLECLNDDGGFVCGDCSEGYEDPDGDRVCTDIDECNDGLDDCSADQTCLNTDGGFTCLAAPGTPDITLSRVAVEFGDVPIGSTDSTGVLIANEGSGNLVVSSIDLVGPSGQTDTPFSVDLVDIELPLTLAPNENAVFRVKYTPENDLGDSGTVRIFSNDPDELVREVSLTGRGAGEADLIVFKTALQMIAVPGSPLEFVIVTANRGPDTARNVNVTDVLPSGMTPLSTGSNCAFANGEVSCALGDLVPGQVVITPIVMASSGLGPYVNAAHVSSDSVDPVPANNAHQITRLQAEIAAPGTGADLEVIKTASPTRLVLGLEDIALPPVVTYEVVVRNNGPDVARLARLVDLLSGVGLPSVTLASLTASQGTCEVRDSRATETPLTIPASTPNELTITCELGDIASGDEVLVTMVVETDGPSFQSVLNAAAAASETPDPDLTNNEAIVIVPEPGILGDVDGDGLVSRIPDFITTARCRRPGLRDTEACDSADVDGDGDVDRQDAATVSANLNTNAPPVNNNNQATFTPGTNERAGITGELFQLLNGAGAQYGGFDKFVAIGLFGSLDVPTIPLTGRTSVSSGSYRIFTDSPPGTVVGLSGCNTCIGVLARPPDGSVISIHFDSKDDPVDTLEGLDFPQGTRIALCGGNNSSESNNTLWQVTTFLLDNAGNLSVDGYFDHDGLWWDFQTGRYVSVQGGDKPSTNVDSD